MARNLTKSKTKSKKKSSGTAKRAVGGKSRPHDHPSHKEGAVRLRRARGHLNKVIQMAEEDAHCTDILQQLSAVISALGGCRTLFFSGHLKTCLRPALKSGNESLIDEIEKLSSKVMKAH